MCGCVQKHSRRCSYSMRHVKIHPVVQIGLLCAVKQCNRITNGTLFGTLFLFFVNEFMCGCVQKHSRRCSYSMRHVKIHPVVQIGLLCAVKQCNRITNVPISHLYCIQLITALLRLDRFLSVAYC